MAEIFVSYRRVSTDDQAASRLGLDHQFAEMERYCNANGVHLLADFEEQGVSARRWLRRRPRGSDLLECIREGPCTVLVTRFDRLWRDVADAALTIKEFNKRGIKLVSLTEPFDISTGFGRRMVLLMVLMGEFEVAIGGERTTNAMKQLRARGKATTGNPAFGWKADDDNNLIKDPAEQKLKARILRLRTAGYGVQAIASALNADGILARSGRPWNKSSVRSVLKAAGRLHTSAAPPIDAEQLDDADLEHDTPTAATKEPLPPSQEERTTHGPH